MLRISEAISTCGGGVTLSAEGYIVGSDVQLLAREGERCLERQVVFCLNLDGVGLIDEGGLDLLAQWAALGVRLQGGSSYIRALLAGRGLA